MFTGAIMSNCVRMMSTCCALTCNCNGMRVARFFMKTTVALDDRCLSDRVLL